MKKDQLAGAVRGRGMSAFTSSSGSAGAETQVTSLPIGVVEPREKQQRGSDDAQDTSDLDDSIAARGIDQPILVRASKSAPGMYEIIAGERRWRSAKKNGLASIPVVVKDVDDLDFEVIQWTENVKRRDLSLRDKMFAVEKVRNALQAKLGKPPSNTDLAKAIHEDSSWLSMTTAILNGPKDVLYLSKGETDIRKLYDLVKLYEVDEKLAKVYVGAIDEGESISRASIQKARDEAKVRLAGGSTPEKESVKKPKSRKAAAETIVVSEDSSSGMYVLEVEVGGRSGLIKLPTDINSKDPSKVYVRFEGVDATLEDWSLIRVTSSRLS